NTVVLSTTLLFSIANCGIAPINVDGIKIVNGEEAAENEYPFQVVLYPGTSGCGGSIIKKRWILTAAHCLFDKEGNPVKQNDVIVAYGSSNRSEHRGVYAVQYIVHENYDNETFANDIALVELPNDLIWENDATVQPICLAEESDIIVGGKAVVTGWGALFYEDESFQVQLREVVLDIISDSQCASLAEIPDATKVVCALTPSKDSCQGDSGGPMVVKTCSGIWVQIGVVSFGDECAKPNAPGVYTRVPAYRAWIDENTGSSTAC
ncbi:transmembrane protease serine 11D-like, partial [Palaemon carinicauda]|uniref:transmembrane protease serine 11D-like n=1 Tax=Palaemon carinicauda TaxID=392227 RepID=UPI0035B63A74